MAAIAPAADRIRDLLRLPGYRWPTRATPKTITRRFGADAGIYSYGERIVRPTLLGYAVRRRAHGDSATTKRHQQAARMALERAGYVALGTHPGSAWPYDHPWTNFAKGV